MISNIQTQPKLPLHGLDIGGLNHNNPTAVKTSTIAKAIIGVIAVAATVGFTFVALATANPLFLIGTAVAVGILMSLTGAQVHAKVGYPRPAFIDHTFDSPVHRRVFHPFDYVPAPVMQEPKDHLRGVRRDRGTPAREPALPARAREAAVPARAREAAVPARGNTPVIPVRDAGVFHAPLGFKR